MDIQFTAIGRKNPRNTTAPLKYHAHIVHKGLIDAEDLMELLHKKTRLSMPDACIAVLELLAIIENEVLHGKAVQLGKLGSLRLAVKSDAAESQKKLRTTAIKEAYIQHRSDKHLKKLLKTLSFTKLRTNY